jgi:hypothetical protein
MPKEEPRPSGDEPYTPNIEGGSPFRAINWQPTPDVQRRIEQLANTGRYRRNGSRAEALERARSRHTQRAEADE